jgi:8-oxo-dGTP diphosphatase
MAKVSLTCMCMIQDLKTNKVLVQDRVLDWKGISFPAGGVEEGESLVEAAIREMKEETGLTVSNLRPCGIVHWYNDKTGDRHLVFNYKTSDFFGELLPETEEGKVFWVTPEELPVLNLSDGFTDRLPMFFEEKNTERFQVWNESGYNPDIKWF